MITLEADPHHAAVAAANSAHAGLDSQVAIRLGKALDLLPVLAAEGGAPFDLVFIDADKDNNAPYLQWALRLGRSGTVIICDNVVRDGRVINADSTEPAVRGTRALFDQLAATPGLSATALQTVGSKGYDGFVLAVVD